LKAESEANRFRADLFYRLSVIQIDIPPLRERGDDIRVLAEHYMASFRSRLRKNINRIDPEALAAFACYQWPGNVRELRNVVERAMILEDGNEITIKYLPRALTGDIRPATEARGETRSNEPFRLPAEGISLEYVEMSLVRQALERSGGNQTKAAELLDISRDQLRYRMKKLEEGAATADA
ncbi:MAG TPA: helix-turn-helix domain-containing protein, partial [Pyrinomonadaceae bacterium]|nr:helix-turn-helix domain-containing protein [Pyrinomonadaceae bacterium]